MEKTFICILSIFILFTANHSLAETITWLIDDEWRQRAGKILEKKQVRP